MKIELLGKKWNIITIIPSLSSSQGFTFRSPQNQLFIPVCIHCDIITVVGSVTTIPYFQVIDDTGNIIFEYRSPAALLANSVYHFSYLSGTSPVQLNSLNLFCGMPSNAPFIETDFKISLVTPHANDTVTLPVIYGLISDFE